MAIDWSRFREIVLSNQTFVLTSHVRPDCDALGSELGMAAILDRLGKQVRIVNGHETPPNLQFIDPEKRIRVLHEQVEAAELIDVDVLMVLDTSAWGQLGTMADVIRKTSAHKVVLDHHQISDDLGAETFRDEQAEATGRLVVEAAEALEVPLNEAIATPLFAAVATDTGWFRFGSTTSETYRTAAKLVDAGACPAGIFARLYERDTLGRVKLRGLILSRIEVELDGRLAHTYVLKEDFRKTDALPSDTEDVVNMALAIEGTEVAVIIVEQAQGGFKISFRSRSDVDCSQIASQFDGGGHKAAAGALVRGSLHEVQPRVLDAVRTAMQ